MPRVEIPQFGYKVVMLGDISSGKTSLVYRFTQGYYRDEGHPATTGAVFSVKKIQAMSGMTCNVQIWDTAGVPERTKFAHLYYKTADAAIICCDITNPQSFEVLRVWLEELRKHMSERNLVVAIAVTKTDLNSLEDFNATTRLVNDAKVLAEEYNCIFMPTSSKTNKSIHELFQTVSERVYLLKDHPHSKYNSTSPSYGKKGTSELKNRAKKSDGTATSSLHDDIRTPETMMEYILPTSMTKGSCCVIS